MNASDFWGEMTDSPAFSFGEPAGEIAKTIYRNIYKTTMSDKIELKGKVKTVGAVQEFPSGFTKRELILGTDLDTQWPQEIPIEFPKDKGALLDKVSPSDEVAVSINIRGREHKGRHYVSLTGWRVEVTGQAAKPSSPVPVPGDDDETDDIPF